MKGKSRIQAVVLTALLVLCVCLVTACGSSSSRTRSGPSAYGYRTNGSANTVSDSESEPDTADADTVEEEPEIPEDEQEVPEEEPKETVEEDAEEDPVGFFDQIRDRLVSGSDSNTSTPAIQFTEDWYETYTFFEDEKGNELEMAWFTFDSGYSALTAYVNQSPWVSCEATDYTKTADGGYQYVDEYDARINLIYYPAEAKVIVNAIPDSYTFHWNSDAGESPYAAVEAEDISQNNTYYLTDRVSTEVFSIIPHYVATESSSSGGYTNISVYCSVVNVLGASYTFYGNILILYNQGDAVVGTSDYDGVEIAPGDGFDGMITFSFPYAANTDPTFMYMSLGDQYIFLSAKPQYGDDWYTVEGTYRLVDSTSSLQLIVEKGVSTYVILSYNSLVGWRLFTSDLVDNVLTIGGHSYRYNEEEGTLYCSYTQQTWEKVNPH